SAESTKRTIAMLKIIGLWAICLTCWSAGTVLAQAKDADKRLDEVEKRMNESEARHQAELKARDERISKLEEEIRQKTIAPAPTKEDVDKVTGDILKDIELRNPVAPTMRVPASFNPDFAV